MHTQDIRRVCMATAEARLQKIVSDAAAARTVRNSRKANMEKTLAGWVRHGMHPDVRTMLEDPKIVQPYSARQVTSPPFEDGSVRNWAYFCQLLEGNEADVVALDDKEACSLRAKEDGSWIAFDPELVKFTRAAELCREKQRVVRRSV